MKFSNTNENCKGWLGLDIFFEKYNFVLWNFPSILYFWTKYDNMIFFEKIKHFLNFPNSSQKQEDFYLWNKIEKMNIFWNSEHFLRCCQNFEKNIPNNYWKTGTNFGTQFFLKFGNKFRSTWTFFRFEEHLLKFLNIF